LPLSISHRFQHEAAPKLYPSNIVGKNLGLHRGIARNHHMRVFAVGGTQNYIHALVDLPPDLALADVVRTMKCNSSAWMRQSVRLFQWQQGYGVFSVSPSQLASVVNYISHQAQHHARCSFEEELRSILKAAGVRQRLANGCVAPEGARVL
jgi:putative transposase